MVSVFLTELITPVLTSNGLKINYFYFIDPEKRIWSFDLSAYEQIRSKVSDLNPSVTIGEIPRFVLKLLKEGTF